LFRKIKGRLWAALFVLFCTALGARRFRTFFVARATAAAGAQMVATSLYILMLLSDVRHARLFISATARGG
jgi:hypothetical protein